MKIIKTVEVPIPLIGLIAATRGMLGAGVGLLVADRLEARHRRTIGWTLLAIGVASTAPLVVQVVARARRRLR